MQDGTAAKKTIFVGGLGDDVDESVLYQSFSPFGDIVEVQLPPAATNPAPDSEPKHRGFAFVTYASPADAQDAIDNMDLNELRGRVIKVNTARPFKATIQPGAANRAIWESEEWLRQYAKPLAQSGGVQGRNAQRDANNADDEEVQDTDVNDDENAMEE
ncbi:RNA-binding domain-containing protein [Imleria badia]|nr:RNA-binding domain-containing protein [Imleria badia]